MTKLFDKPPTLPEFRAEAELCAEGRRIEAGKSKEEVLRQLHELQVSQIELEMQSAALAELQLLKERFEAGLNHYAELYDHAPVSYFSIERSGTISRVNLAAAALLKSSKSKLLGRKFEQFLAPEAQVRFREFIDSVFDSGLRQVLEVSLFEDLAGAGRVRIEANVDPASQVCRMVVTDLGGADWRESALSRAFVVFDNIREGVMITDAGNRIVSVNPAFAEITGYLAEEAIGRDPSFLSRGVHAPAFYAAMWDSLESHGSWQGELLNKRRDGRLFVVWLSITQMRTPDGSVGNFVGVFSDITERKQAEVALRAVHRELDQRVSERTAELMQANQLLHQEIAERERAQAALQETEQFFHATIDALSDRVLVLDEGGIVRYANKACCDCAGHVDCGIDYLARCETDQRWLDGAGVELAAGIRGVAAGRLEAFSMEYQFQPRRKEPARRDWLQVSVSRFSGGGPLRVVVAHADITGRKDMERALRESYSRLRHLAMHLETLKEDERKRISRDIHDELGQNLLALRIDISMLGARTAHAHPLLHRRVSAVLSNIDTTIRSVRGIINELRPPVLDLGLQAAMEWQVDDFRKRSGIDCRLTASAETLFAAIDSETGVVLFRIVQEALSNVMRHARARHVTIAMQAEAAELTLRIRDDGVGIPSWQRRKGERFGLMGIAERITALGGYFELADFAPGQGCCLSMRIPLPRRCSPRD
ncbi:MAG TPA: PAS domain S-box protein [Janthinobacterium sp.]|jgi:PAS domain S-box-containing protein|nr:PAS domain S-box protein [Janthinobacterium sp.]